MSRRSALRYSPAEGDAALRGQQEIALALLRRLGRHHDREARSMTKDKWVALLRAAGLGDTEMMQWHAAFEHQAPEGHQDFLESLGIPPAEIARIRRTSATQGNLPQTGSANKSHAAGSGGATRHRAKSRAAGARG